MLLFGASGFIGRWVARALSQHGADLALAVRSPADFAPIQRRWGIQGRVLPIDLAVPGSGASVVATLRPAVVFNLAGYGVDRAERDAALTHRMNRDLPAELAEALGRHRGHAGWSGARLVHAGSALEYGSLPGVADEAGAAEPHTLYGRSKLEGTQAVLDAAARAGLPSVVARLFTVYGPGEHEGRLLPVLLAAARTGGDVALSAGTQCRDFAYVQDVAEGLLRLALADAGAGVCANLATGALRSVREFAEIAAGALGIPDSRLRFGQEPVRADEMALAGVKIDRLLALTAWKPTLSIDQGVRATANFDSVTEQAGD